MGEENRRPKSFMHEPQFNLLLHLGWESSMQGEGYLQEIQGKTKSQVGFLLPAGKARQSGLNWAKGTPGSARPAQSHSWRKAIFQMVNLGMIRSNNVWTNSVPKYNASGSQLIGGLWQQRGYLQDENKCILEMKILLDSKLRKVCFISPKPPSFHRHKTSPLRQGYNIY